MDAKELVSRLHWLGHDSFRLDGPPVIYFDPWKLKSGLPEADLVLVSHEHADHCSPDDVQRSAGPIRSWSPLPPPRRNSLVRGSCAQATA